MKGKTGWNLPSKSKRDKVFSCGIVFLATAGSSRGHVEAAVVSWFSAACDRIAGQVVKTSDWRAADLGSIPAFAAGLFPSQVIPLTWYYRFLRGAFSESSHTTDMVLLWLPRQTPGVIGSALGLVGPVSVYCDCVRQQD